MTFPQNIGHIIARWVSITHFKLKFANRFGCWTWHEGGLGRSGE